MKRALCGGGRVQTTLIAPSIQKPLNDLFVPFIVAIHYSIKILLFIHTTQPQILKGS